MLMAVNIEHKEALSYNGGLCFRLVKEKWSF
jgi:hypothetical protein